MWIFDSDDDHDAWGALFPHGAFGSGDSDVWGNEDEDDSSLPLKLKLLAWAFLLLVVLIVAALFYGAYWLLKTLIPYGGAAWNRIAAFLQTSAGVITVGVMGVFVVSCLLFWFRCRNLKWYGVTEVGFSIFVSARAVQEVTVTPDVSHWLAVLAAMYLCVRGLNNIRDALRPKVTKDQVIDIVIHEMRKRMGEDSGGDAHEAAVSPTH